MIVSAAFCKADEIIIPRAFHCLRPTLLRQLYRLAQRFASGPLLQSLAALFARQACRCKKRFLRDVPCGHERRRKPLPVFSGEVRDAPGLRDAPGPEMAAKLRRQTDREVRDALRRARHAGRIPAGLERLWRREGAEQADWGALLRRFVAHCAENDFCWCAPNRRFLHTGCYLPGRRDVRIPCLAVAVDCSGSVDTPALSAFMRELEQALLPYEAEAVILCHDCRIQSVTRGRGRDMLRRVQPRGGGGTDFRPVGRWLEEEGLRPACLIWFTDLECDQFPPAPPCPTLWLVWGDNDRQPPFGERVALTAPAPAEERMA